MSDTNGYDAAAAASRRGPSVTINQIEAAIVGEQYLRPEASTLTICILTLRNGFTVTGESACADPANFDEEVGRRYARHEAREKIWALEGYLLREKLWQQQADGRAALMNFGGAIRALKAGGRVAREGWNGKGMWLSLSCNGLRNVPAAAFWSPHNAAHAMENGGMAMVLPSITMKTATGEILMGWLASQTDMLAEDWVEV